ncbi:MAG: hypothetical protein N2115_03850 [bacterium]|nr:hypothetical protein [bacterium]
MDVPYKRFPVCVNPAVRHPSQTFLRFDSDWYFKLDPDDAGTKEKWYSKENLFSSKISVPGCWQGQGFGFDENIDEVWDFRIKTKVFRASYHGTGWYARSFRVPEDWKRKKLWLCFGGVHPQAEIWLNGKFLGKHNGPFVPFAYDITQFADKDNQNFLTVRVSEENRWLGLAYNWCGYWSGLYRDVELVATENTWIEHLWIHPDIDKKCLNFLVITGGDCENTVIQITVKDPSGKACGTAERHLSQGKSIFNISIKNPQPWFPENPGLYQVDVEIKKDGIVLDCKSERVGFLKLSTHGKHLLINDNPYYMFGTGDFAVNPETGCPDTDRERWRKKLQVLRDYGYLYVRCQSYVPTPEYLDVADEVGLLVQSEMGMMGAWGGHSQYHQYQWPQPHSDKRRLLRMQWNATVVRDVNHVSANLYCMSNEHYNEPLYPETAWRCYHETKTIKPSCMVIWTDGIVKKIKGTPLDFYCSEANCDKKVSMPVIQHEFRWWTSFPDVRNKNKFMGAIRPYALEIAEANAKNAGLLHLLPDLVVNSQKLQFIEAKTKLEQIRRDNSTLAGICHFTAMDIGFSPQGVIDEFYERKVISPEQWKQTTGQTAVLIDAQFDDRVYTAGSKFEKNVFVSDFSHPALEKPTIRWFITTASDIIEGAFTYKHVPFRTIKAGKILATLPRVTKPEKISLRVVVEENKKTFENNWNFWVFPEIGKPANFHIYGKSNRTWVKTIGQQGLKGHLLEKVSPGIIVSEILDRRLAQYIGSGKKLLLAIPEGFTRPFFPKLGLTKGRYFFTCPANYPTYEDGNTGTIINNHSMLGDFPHDSFCDLQFYRMIAEYPPIDLRPFGQLKQEPVIRSFSTCFRMYPLAYLVEFSYKKGHIIITSLNLDQKIVEARYLFSQIIQYLENVKSLPENNLEEDVVDWLIEESSTKPDVFGALKVLNSNP